MAHTCSFRALLHEYLLPFLMVTWDSHCPCLCLVPFAFQDLHVSQGDVDNSVDMDRFNRNMPELGRKTHQVLQVGVGVCVYVFEVVLDESWRLQHQSLY